MLGKLLSLPVKILNVPFKAIDKITGADDRYSDIPRTGYVLDKVSEAFEDIDK